MRNLVLNKNRIYTAISRGQVCVYIVCSDIEALNIAATKNPPYRCENLARRLSNILPHMKPFKVERTIVSAETSILDNELPVVPLMPQEQIPDDMDDTGIDFDDFD